MARAGEATISTRMGLRNCSRLRSRAVDPSISGRTTAIGSGWLWNGVRTGRILEGEYGYRFDVGPVSTEMFGGMGMANSNSTVDWGIKTTWRGDGEPPDSSLEERTTNPGHYWWSGRGGIHVGARRSGPWGELELSRQNIFETPSSKSLLWLEQTSVAAGWSHFFDNKMITGFVRAHWVGGSWIPTAGVQLTGNVPIPPISARSESRR